MYRIKRVVVMLFILLLAGCGQAEETAVAVASEPVITSMETEPVLSYEVPESTPGILINQLGYITDSTKMVIFKGEELPSYFHVVNAETGKTEFAGVTEDEEYNDETKEYNSYGDFSQLQKPGTYYIEAPLLGRSYSFVIEDDLYDGVFQEAFKQYYYNRCGITLTEEYAGERAHNACHTGKAVLREDISVSVDVSGGWHQDQKGSKDVAVAAKNIGIMLLAYELYGDSFTDDMGIPESGNGIPDILDEVRYEIQWLLKMQDATTGGVYAGVTVYDQTPGRATNAYVDPAEAEASRAFAMVLSKFSYLYQNYDTEYATGCLKAADRAWKYAELTDPEGMDEWRFAAAAELYRASGLWNCHKAVTDYLQTGAYKEAMDEIAFLGCVTYVSTKQKVNTELCSEVMKVLMERAEDVSLKSRDSFWGTEGNEAQDNNAQLLQNMMYLTMVDHVITNHEYETIIENHLHYFMGRNAKAISYIDNVGERNYKEIDENLGIMKQFDADSKLIFIFSEIVSSHRR
ncbi:MAG: glycoside hydrolase family 9 protein [Lachnospiraceae bacterium]|nr:glycoside hydrolase family 9 protein [Lachnospiraceae bacterium]